MLIFSSEPTKVTFVKSKVTHALINFMEHKIKLRKGKLELPYDLINFAH